MQNERKKVWILAITCLYTRGINLKICMSANVKDFIRAIQLHVYQYGIFETCMSDSGSQIVSGTGTIQEYLSDEETKQYLNNY